MNVGIDQSRQDDAISEMVDGRPGVPVRQVGESAVPQDSPVGGDGHRAVVMGGDRIRRPDDSRIVAKADRAAAQDSGCSHGDRGHPATRSSMRKRRMRQTLSIALAYSATRSLSTRASKAARILSLEAPLTAKMNGMPKRAR